MHAMRANSPATILRELAGTWVSRSPDEMVYWLEVDINGDGTNDLLVTSTSCKDEDDIASYEWIIYQGNSDGSYTRIDGTKALYSDETPTSESTVELTKGRYWVGLIPEINKHGLLFLVIGAGGHAKAQLVALLIEGNSFIESPVGAAVNAEESFSEMQKRFQGSGVPETHEARAATLAQ